MLAAVTSMLWNWGRLEVSEVASLLPRPEETSPRASERELQEVLEGELVQGVVITGRI